MLNQKTKRIIKNGQSVNITIEKDGIVTLDGVEDIINAMQIKSVNGNSIVKLYGLFVGKNCSYQQVWTIISGASKMRVLCKKNQDKVTIDILELLKNIEDEHNLSLYKMMGDINAKFKEYVTNVLFSNRKTQKMSNEEFKETKRNALRSVDGLLKQAWKTVKQTTDDTDVRLQYFSKEELDNLYELACIYDAIIKYTPNTKYVHTDGKEYLRVADYIFGERFLSLKSKFINDIIARRKDNKEQSVNTTITKLLKAMTELDYTYGEREVFSHEDIATLLISVPSVLRVTTEGKFLACRKALTNYLKVVTDMSKGTDLQERLKSISAKSIIIKSGTILNSTEHSIFQSTNFLMGKSISEMEREYLKTHDSTSKCSKYQNTVDQFPNMRISNMTIEDHIRIMESQTNIIKTINYSSLGAITEQLMNLFIKVYHPGIIDVGAMPLVQKKNLLLNDNIDFNKFFTGKNIGILFRSDVKTDLLKNREQEMVETIKIFSKYVDIKTIERIVKNNIGLLFQDPIAIQEKIDELKEKYQENSQEFNDELVLLINDDYSISFKKNGNDISNRRIKKNKTTIIENGHDWVDVGFISNNPTKDVPLTDNEKYEVVNKELEGVKSLCAVCMEDNSKAMKDWIQTNNTQLARRLATPLWDYPNNINHKAKVLSALKSIKRLVDSIESKDIKMCIKYELDNAIECLNKCIGSTIDSENSLIRQVYMYEAENNKFFVEDRTRTKTFDAQKYKDSISSFDDILEKATLIKQRLKSSQLSSLDAIKNDREQVLQDYKNLVQSNEDYKRRREFADEIETIIAELKETIVGFNLTKMFFDDLFDGLSKDDNKQIEIEKPAETIIDKKNDEQEELQNKINCLKQKVCEKLDKKEYELIKTNYKGKALKRVCHNLGIEGELYEDILELCNLMKALDKIKAENIQDSNAENVQNANSDDGLRNSSK